MLYLLLTLKTFSRSIFFIANFEDVFVSWTRDKIQKTISVHIKQYDSFFKTCSCDMSKSTWFK